MGTKAYVGCGVFFAILGIALIIVGTFVLPKEDGKLMTNKLNEYLTVDSTDAQLYAQWAGGFDTELDYQMVFYFYNLTNPDDLLANGAVPVYTQHGPYIWRRYRKAVDVSFLDNGNQVQFSENTIYQFDQVNSNGSDSDLFTNVNPAYVGAVSIAKGELNMIAGATGGYLQNITDYLTGGAFLTLLGAYDFPNFWYPLYNGNIEAINATVQSTSASEALFFSYWANFTSASNTMAGNWSSTMLLSYNTTSSNITFASAQALFAPGNQSLLDPTAVDIWNKATYDIPTATSLAAQFGLSLNQLQSVLAWRNSVFVPAEVYPHWISVYDLDQVTDIGWLQFVWGIPLGGQTVQTLFPISFGDLGYNNQISFELMDTDAFNSSNWRQVAFNFNPQTGLENLTIFQATITPGSTVNPLNLTDDQISVLTGFALGWGGLQVLPNLLQVNGPTGGLIATKKIHDWVFNCHDRVIDLLRNPAPTCNMLFNDTTMPPNILWTGKDDISKINTYVNFQGSPTVDGVFATPLNISNQMIYTELGQFAPNLPVGGYLRPFDPHFMRPMQLNYTKNETVKDLNSFRYVLDPAWVFARDDNLFQEGIGFGNATGAQNDSPIFLSLWDQLYVGQCFPPHNATNTGNNNTSYCTATYNTSSVIGQFPTNDSADSAYLHIEPQTGVTLESWKRLQVNLLVQQGTGGPNGYYTLVPGNANIKDNVYYPLSKAGEYVIVSDDLANQIKNKLNIVPKLNNAMFYVGVTVGPVFVVFGIILVAVGLRRRRRGYSAINE